MAEKSEDPRKGAGGNKDGTRPSAGGDKGSSSNDHQSPDSNSKDAKARELASEDGLTEADEDEDEEDEEDDDEEEEEPKLKYARLTSHLGSVYRNGDATSAFTVMGDKMLLGTHNGNIHVVSLPSFRVLRVYHAHTASITSISASPVSGAYENTPLDPDPEDKPLGHADANKTPQKPSSRASASLPRSPRTPQKSRTPQAVPNNPSNAIYIATSSMDGKICVASLIEEKDVQLRDFARPVQVVSLSPQYKVDRTYLSGGLAGNLVLTIGGKSGTSSTSTTTGTAAASAAGWLGTIGLGTHSGKDTILHSGEGAVSNIKWSLTGKYVVWLNEHGIKIMRSNIDLESNDSELAWKRFAHIDRPQTDEWDEMVSVWKGRIEWIDETSLETDEHDQSYESSKSTTATAKLKQQSKGRTHIEKLIIGWGGTIWLINVHPGGPGVGKLHGERSAGRAEIIKMLRMDCIISGLSLYTPTLLLVLAYVPDEQTTVEPKSPEKGHRSKGSTSSEPSGGIPRRQNASPPELKLIDLNTSEEIETDNLTVSRFERLSASDYHLGIVAANRARPVEETSRGTLELLAGMGSGMWNATIHATNILSSAASVRSGSDSDPSIKAQRTVEARMRKSCAHPNLLTQGMRIFIQSPYDCILATKRDLTDHLMYLLEHQSYKEAWQLVEDHPEVITSSPEKLSEIGPGTPTRATSDDFYGETGSTIDSASRLLNSAVEKEKRRIGELWVQQLISSDDWAAAGRTCQVVITTADRWKHWVYIFASADKFDEIADHVPARQMQPTVPSDVYEVILAHYIATNRPKVEQLLTKWSPDLFNIPPVTKALENQLKYRDVRQDSIEGGQAGRDWHIVMGSLGKLYVADGRPREALRCYIKLSDADAAMSLIRDFHLVDAVVDDIPSLILLRVTKQQARSASIEELRQVTAEAIALLVDEAQHGLIRPAVVVQQLQDKDLPLYLFFYISSLWRGHGLNREEGDAAERLVAESKSLVDEFADLAVHLFASYDRELLMEFLTLSNHYTFEKATQECEARSYVPELVHLYSKTGQTKRALFLIIDSLHDVPQAIAFTKSQNDQELWDDLLNYSMDKPRFIRGLLEDVGTAIDPVKLVRRIPEGLEIQGLREGLSRMIKEYVVQQSISEGVTRVLRGEVAQAQDALRRGQRKGMRFEVASAGKTRSPRDSQTGRCVDCDQVFGEEDEVDSLVGFACGHVYHLRHLIQLDRSDIPSIADPDETFSAIHSVGSKVTHARLLQNQIHAGCRECKAAAE